jgi:hypothetical protein
MGSYFKRLGIIPYLVQGLSMFGLGAIALAHLYTLWPYIPSQDVELTRALGEDLATSGMILNAALPEMLVAQLSVTVIIITGLAMPILYLVNRRYAPAGVSYFVVLRQSMWLGFWVAGCVWLQMLRALTVAVAVLVLGVLLLFELLLQIRGRALSEAQSVLEA